MLLLVDLDGVVYRGPQPVPGMPELLRRCVAAGDRVIYCTNNSRWHRSEYRERLDGLGAPTQPDCIVTAARATALALVEDQVGQRVMVLGGPGLRRELRDVGLRPVESDRRGLAAHPRSVVVGVDFNLTYRRLSVAAEAARGGARFLATNRDPLYPTPEGTTAGAGALVAAVAVAAGREPDLVIGKPEPTLFLEAARLAGVPPAQAVVIGDSLGSDIAAARAVGARSILMLTGVTTASQARSAPAELLPTAVAGDAAELERLLDELR